MRNTRKILAFLISVVLVFCAVAVIAAASTDTVDYGASEGRTFTGAEELSMTNVLTSQPMTYKAVINVPEGASKKGVIIGNYRETDVSGLDFQISGAGNPSIYFIDSDKVETTITFDYDVRGKGWLDLVITQTITDTGSEFTCYINGESIGVVTSDKPLKISLASCQRLYRFLLGKDWASNGYNFKGSIQNVAIYDKALTAEEVAAAYSGGVSITEPSLMAYYDLTLSENQTGSKVTDSTGKGHDLEPLFQETRRDPNFDYAYSLAVVGDTQHLVYDDAHKGTQWMAAIYDWLVANKDEKKIKFVMGVGDITHRDGKDDVDDGVDKTNVEWDISVEQLNKLYNAGIPYSLIVGNHDTTAQLDKYFAKNPNFTEADIGYYDGDSLGNYYMKFTANENDKYIVFGLDYGANDSKLKWAGEIIAANPDYKIIITTHAYMSANGTTLEAHESTSVPRPHENVNASQKDKNNGDDVWHELASKYENVVLVFSGHISASDIIYRKDYGDNGNTVYQMLMDFQTMDAKYNRETGMIAMLYFNADGSVAYVEYVSAYKSLKAQESDENAKDIVYRPAVNSFTIEYPTEKGVGVETEYGTISPTYVDETIYPVILFKEDKTCVGGFYNINRAMESILSVYNDNDGSYVMLLRGNVSDNGYVDTVNSGAFTGNLVIDLGGFTVHHKSTNYMMNFTYSGTAGNSSSVTFKNGTLVKDGYTLGLIKFDYNKTLTKDANCDITFENVTFRSLVNYNNTSTIFVTYEGGYGTATAKVNVNAVFNDCTFDFVGSINKAVMIPMRHYSNSVGYKEKDQVVFNTVVNGGTAIAESASEFTSYFYLANDNTNGRADSIKFGRNEAGNYLQLVLPAGATAPTTSYKGTGGESCTFNKMSSTTENDTYGLINADALQTKYGTIGAQYENAELYPIVLFEKTASGYTFKGAYATFNEATSGTAEKTDTATTGVKTFSGWYGTGKTYVFLLRSDAVFTNYTNMNQARGTYIVDLNGYTLTNTGSSYLYSINQTINSTSTNPVTLNEWYKAIFINGTIVSNADSALFAMNYGSGSKLNRRSYALTYTFENVTFKLKKKPIFANFESGYSKLTDSEAAMRIEVSSTFNNCTFDYTNYTGDLPMIDMIDDGGNTALDRTIHTVTVNGGNIIANKAFSISQFFRVNTGTSSFTNAAGETCYRNDVIIFGKNADGEYITLTLPSSIAAPSESEIYTNASGSECIFVKSYDSAGKTIYRLRPVATVGIEFTPKVSLSLDRNLVMNVYIPSEILLEFTFNGISYANLEELDLETTVIDDKTYYVLRVSIPAAEAAKNVQLIATVVSGDVTATATFNFTVVKYAEKVLNSENESEKQLAKDILAYVKAAYVYFAASNDASEIARVSALVDSLIGNDYDAKPTVEGSDTADVTGIESATFVLDGEPSMRFYLAEGADASLYEFYINGSKVDSIVSEDGTYVDIDVYAYLLCETVTYTIDGEAGGSYHINAYYTYVSGNGYTANDKAELVALTECFWKYLQSAREYRTSVLAN